MLSVEDFSLRKLQERDREQVLRWRNSDRIRANMYTDQIISMEEHDGWFGRVKDNPTTLYLIFEHQGRPAGLVNFTRIDCANNKCMWGFYLGETNLPRGSGTVMGYMAMNHIFEDRKIRKVSGEVLDFNQASKKFFLRLGFTLEGRMRQHVLKDGSYTDVILFSLLADEWRDREKVRVEKLLHGYKGYPV